MSRKVSTPTEKLAKEILSYFLRNPQAADSLKGVAEWRLLEEKVHQQVEDTHAALRWLVGHGFLTLVSPRFTEAVYQLNLQNRGEAEEFLARKKQPRKRIEKRRVKERK